MRTVRYAFPVLVVVLMLILVGCGPKTDTTDKDPLSDYSVDVTLPFPTSGAVSATQTPGYTIRPDASIKILGWMNEQLDSTVQDPYTELSLGSMGTAVRNLQKRLIELGYMSGTASGTFDQATAQAVRLFEAAYGRTATGVASQLMQVYLFSDSAKNYTGIEPITTQQASAGYQQLERGSVGTDVTRLQNRLIELGYMDGKANGVFDQTTEDAVKAFEAAYGKQRTGIATVSMQNYLFADSALRAGQSAQATARPTAVPADDGEQDTVTYKALQYGSKGESVKQLQQRLKELGYLSGKVDGIYGNATVKAVKAFEKAYGQKQTGVASVGMQMHLYAADALAYGSATPAPTAAASEDTYRTLSKGSYGEDVVALQARLKKLGYLSGKADGYYGDDTASAVRAFESRHGRTQSGVATAAMQKFLFSDSAMSNNSDGSGQSSYTALSEGSYGSAVYALQQRLIELNFMAGTPTGYFDANTVEAVKAFEAAYGRNETGVATVALQEKLYADDAPTGNVTTPTGGSYKRLKNGDKGANVARLQARLIELGYLTGTADGYYGSGTEDAVKAFEAAYGKTPTGIATSELQSYLYSDSAYYNTDGDVAVSYSVLSKGDSGSEVQKLQTRLKELNYLTGKCDGKYGAETVSAVKAFQKALGLKQTGTASAALQKELYSDDAPAKNSTTVVTVNKTAYVSVAKTNVYASINDSEPMATLSIGAEVTILRTRGEWAEIRNSSGDVAYAKLADFALSSESSGDSGETETVVTVNAYAMVVKDLVTVYAEPDELSDKLGTLSKGATVTWTRTRGSWAEVKNSGGSKGYVRTSQLTVLEKLDDSASTGGDTKKSEYSTLKNGSKGDSVKKLQRRLKQLGYFDGDIGGNYLTKTTKAVKEFQAAIGMKQTGTATAGLQEILFSDVAPPAGQYAEPDAGSYQELKLGDAGSAVETLQYRLAALGYLNAPDAEIGTFDSATRSAVIDVQSAMGITADGIASAELQAFLSSDAAKGL